MVSQDNVEEMVAGKLEGIEMPVDSQMDLMAADGIDSPTDTFEVEGDAYSAMELAGMVDWEFPYENMDTLVADITATLTA